jgi:LysR family nitrogen assimilation transcriptional regulator
LRPNIRIQANTLPLMTDLVAQGLGYTVLPSCSVVHLVEAGRLAASPLAGLRITWLVARPLNRALTVAARRLLETLFRTVRHQIENGAWRLAQLEPDCRAATRSVQKRVPRGESTSEL